jgi:hypothetical protein
LLAIGVAGLLAGVAVLVLTLESDIAQAREATWQSNRDA